MALSTICIASFLAALTGALMPGPVLMVTVARVAARGFAAAPRIVLGHALLELSVVVGLFWGLGAVLSRAGVQGAIGLLGGAVLLWIGLSILHAVWRDRVRLELKSGSPLVAGGAGRDVGLGVVTSASNPYWLLWWATAGAALAATAVTQRGTPGLAAFYAGHIGGDLAWYTVVGALVAAGRQGFSARLYRGILLVCALFLVVLGAGFLLAGARSLHLA